MSKITQLPNKLSSIVNMDGPIVRPRRKFRAFTVNLIYLAANGLPDTQIAATMKISLARTKFILSCNRAKKEVTEMAFRLSGENPAKAFMKLVPESIAVQAEVMRNPREKGAIRLLAANQIQDRALGKPKQQVEINHKSQVRQILEMLQAEKNGNGKPDIETQGRNLEDTLKIEDNTDVPDSFDEIPVAKQGEYRDDVDEWIDKNL